MSPQAIPRGNRQENRKMLSTSQTSVGESFIDHETEARAVPVTLTVRRLQICGFSATEATNLTARLAGLPVVRAGWSARQIEHLMFLRTIVASGRLTT
jgi:hypothetical protein